MDAQLAVRIAFRLVFLEELVAYKGFRLIGNKPVVF